MILRPHMTSAGSPQKVSWLISLTQHWELTSMWGPQIQWLLRCLPAVIFHKLINSEITNQSFPNPHESSTSMSRLSPRSRKQRTIKRKCTEEKADQLCGQLGKSGDATHFEPWARTKEISHCYKGLSLWDSGSKLSINWRGKLFGNEKENGLV